MRTTEALRIIYELAHCRYDGSKPSTSAVVKGKEALAVTKKELLEKIKNDNYQIVIKNETGEEAKSQVE